jgi:hypothetical protein
VSKFEAGFAEDLALAKMKVISELDEKNKHPQNEQSL